jgi:hypothetical protein
MEPLIIHDNPVTDNEPVTGVCEGRIVAFWPAKEQVATGLRAVGSGGYIPAMIVASWAGRGEAATPMPCANLRLFVDGLNVKSEDVCLGSVRYSKEPAYGCWTWIPKA